MSTISHSIHVLHVDDEPDFADLAAQFLERHEDRFDVETATSASDAIDRLAENGYDCIVSDFDMPGQDGIEFLQDVREEYPNLPFILYTGKGSEAVASKAISAGVTDYLQKESGTSQYEVLANRIINAVEGQRAIERAEDTEDWSSTLLEYSSDYVFVVDEAGDVSYTSPSVTRVLGYEPDELTGTGAFDFVHPDDVETAVESFGEILERPNEDVSVEFRTRHADGGYRWLEVRGRNLLDDPVIDGILVNARDITERKQHEQQLREEQAFNELALDNILDFYWVLDTDGQVTDWSDEDGTVTGYTSEEAVGMDAIELFPEHEREYIHKQITRLRETGSMQAESDFRKKDGDLVPYRFDGTVLTEGEGHIERLFGFGQDISERVEREEQLREEREFVEQLINRIPDIFYVADVDGSLQRWNTNLVEVTGYEEAAIAEMSAIDFVAEEDHEQVAEAIMETMTEGKAVREMNIRTADGDLIPYEFTGGRLTDSDGKVSGLAGIGRDLTEHKEREQELERQNERLDRFASVVSHDLRNPLSLAEGRLELAREKCDSEHLDDVAYGIDRSLSMIEDLLILAREGSCVGTEEIVNLADVVERCWRSVEAADASVTVADDKSIQADESRVKQLLENLFRNAIEHGGEDVVIEVGRLPGGFYVADDGPGIPEQDREGVFEPGYSTSDGGNGLGLNIVREIAEAHGWEVRVTDSESGGARFEFSGVRGANA